MRGLFKSLLLTVAVMSPMTTLSQQMQPLQGAVTPQAAYSYMTEYPDRVETASVSTETTYRLEDETYLGADSAGYSEPACKCANDRVYSDTSIVVATGVAGNVGWATGYFLGGVAADMAVSLIPIGAGYTTYAVGLGTLAAGPWIGAAVIGGLAIW